MPEHVHADVTLIIMCGTDTSVTAPLEAEV